MGWTSSELLLYVLELSMYLFSSLILRQSFVALVAVFCCSVSLLSGIVASNLILYAITLDYRGFASSERSTNTKRGKFYVSLFEKSSIATSSGYCR